MTVDDLVETILRLAKTYSVSDPDGKFEFSEAVRDHLTRFENETDAEAFDRGYDSGFNVAYRSRGGMG